MKKALIVQGGWQGHEPSQVADILAKALRENDFEVEVSDTLDSFRDLEALQGVVKFPVRIKCATLAWNTLTEALGNTAT